MGRETSSLHLLVSLLLMGGKGADLVIRGNVVLNTLSARSTSMLLRRDQIWLTERDRYGATQLRSIHDFEGRESEDIEKRYYEGRYRSLPIVKSE